MNRAAAKAEIVLIYFTARVNSCPDTTPCQYSSLFPVQLPNYQLTQLPNPKNYPITNLTNYQISIVKSVLHLQRDHAWITKVRTAEGVAHVYEVLLVGEVQGRDLGRPVFTERLPD